MSQWQPDGRSARPPAIPPEFRDRENGHPNGPMHVQRQFPQGFQPLARRPRPARRRPPYPYDLVRFPAGALPGSRRRRRGVSVYRIFFLGRHPVLLLIELWLTVAVIGAVCAWIVLVALAWALWTGAVSVVWLCRVAAAAVRR